MSTSPSDSLGPAAASGTATSGNGSPQPKQLKAQPVGKGGHGFGTLPVFLASISTILGAIMFLRFGYAVGHVGLAGAIGLIILAHLVTVPTALAIAEISTNRRVEGGGEYFIISRSFGVTIGSVIGVSLYLSQAISVAFYMIAFAEAFRFIEPWINQQFGIEYQPIMVSLPATALLLLLMLTRGASLGVSALYVVVAVLAVSLVLFFIGHPVPGMEPQPLDWFAHVDSPDSFILVFAIVFPAFTGITAGVGLSGDLANPRRSLPLGTLLATATGFLVYLGIVYKLASSAPPERLATDQFVMADIAMWGPVIPIGLACATLSSALGSILVAPRTMQALAADGALPIGRTNQWLAAGVGDVNEPRNATLLTAALVLVIVFLGDVNFVASLISMFFMITYGALCAISFLEHFAAQPSYRPSFRSHWLVSLIGAISCLLLMFQMDPLYALLAIAFMAGLYLAMTSSSGGQSDDLASMFEGVMAQLVKKFRLRLSRQQHSANAKVPNSETSGDRPRQEWRPSIIMVSDRTFERGAPLEFMRWLCDRHSFGTYLHFIQGQLSRETIAESGAVRERLIKLSRQLASPVAADVVISPSMVSALAQALQIPGISGLPNNTAFFEFAKRDDREVSDEVASLTKLASDMDMALLVLRHGERHFGARRLIHLWLTWNDRKNANLMLLIAYMLLGSRDWDGAEIKVFAALPIEEKAERRAEFLAFLEEGRLPVSPSNVFFLSPGSTRESYHAAAERISAKADLVLFGFETRSVEERGGEVFRAHPGLGDVVFVHTPSDIELH